MLVIVGYTLIFYAVIVPTWHDAFELSAARRSSPSGSSSRRTVCPATSLVFTEAATGLAILALLIAYLPDDLRRVLAPRA